jgi:hypothetical protein
VLTRLGQVCPPLADVCQGDGRLNPHYLLAVDGTRFVGDMGLSLEPGSRLVLLSADVGG